LGSKTLFEGAKIVRETSAENYIIGRNPGSILQTDHVAIAQTLDFRSMDNNVPGMEGLPKIGNARKSET